MKIIIVQGMACLGKTSLCKKLVRNLPNAKHFCFDEYKEKLWDKYEFDSAKERNDLSLAARELYLENISKEIKEGKTDYLFLDYCWHGETFNELIGCLKMNDAEIKTIYFEHNDCGQHEKIWQKRSRNFKVRHPAHGATVYHSGKGSGYVNKFSDKILTALPVVGTTMRVEIKFEPYRISRTFGEILDFVRSNKKICKDIEPNFCNRPYNKIMSYRYCGRKERKEIKKIYKESFPKEERFPFWVLRLCSKKDGTSLNLIKYEYQFEYKNESENIGLEFTVRYDGITYLMYFAFEKNHRNKGHGTIRLKELNNENSNILLCIEKPTDEMKKRRKEFYLRNGFFETNVSIIDGGIEYEFLCTEKGFKVTDEILRKRYLRMTNNPIMRTMIKRIFNADNIEHIPQK